MRHSSAHEPVAARGGHILRKGVYWDASGLGEAANEREDEVGLRCGAACTESEGGSRKVPVGLDSGAAVGWGCSATRSKGRGGCAVARAGLPTAPGLLMVMATAAGRRAFVNARANHFSTRSTFRRRRACGRQAARGVAQPELRPSLLLVGRLWSADWQRSGVCSRYRSSQARGCGGLSAPL